MLVNIEELKLHFDGDEELIGDLLDVFQNSYPETLEAMKKAISEDDSTNLELHAHTLKGMIANFFAHELKECAFTLEKMGREKVIGETAQLVSDLEEKLPVAIEEIRSIL